MRWLLLFLALPLSAQVSQIAHTSATSGPSNSSPFSITLPAAPTAGDALVLFCSNYVGDDCVNAAGGWTKVADKSQPGGTLGSSLYYRFAKAGDGASYPLITGNKANAQLSQFRNTDPVYPITDYASSLATTGTSAATPVVTPTHNGLYQLACVAQDETSTVTGVGAPWSLSASAGYGHSAACATNATATSGTSTPYSTTFTLSATEGYGIAAWTILINPAGTSGLSSATLALSATPTTITNGTNVALTATASPSAVSGSATFTNVTTGTNLGTCTLVAGTCTLNTTVITQGVNVIRASVPVGSSYGPSTSNNVTVTNNSTVVTMTTSQVAYVAGTAVSARVIVTPVAATGTLTLKDGTTTIGTGTVTTFLGPGDPGNGQKTYSGFEFSNITLSAGTHSLTAVYSGDGTYQGSTSAAYVNVVSAVAKSPQACSAMSTGLDGAMNGFVPAPNDAYHQRIDGLPADPNSDAAIAEMAAHSNHLHLDFGSGKYGGSGIPYTVVNSTTTAGLPFSLANNAEGPYVADSDIFNVWPGSACSNMIEGHYDATGCTTANPTDGDTHMLTLDAAKCVAYEGYHVRQRPDLSPPQITATNVAAWDLSDRAVPETRPIGHTAADAAGLPLFEGLFKYDEAAAGTINHAIRITTDSMKCDNYGNGNCQPEFLLPLTHQAQVPYHSQYVGYGTRFRLKASFDCTQFGTAIVRNMCTGLKQYGVIIADLGSPLYMSGTYDTRWPDDDILVLQNMTWNGNWEMVEKSTSYAPNRYPAGTAAAISSFTAAPSTITSGSCATLNSATTNASYSTIDKANAFLRGNSNTTNVCPTVTTTYTLYTKNSFLANDDGHQNGTVNAQSVTVTVGPGSSQPTPVSIALSGALALALNGSSTLTCTTTLSDGSARACISPTLTSSATGIVSVSGLTLTGVAVGSSAISATAEGLTSAPVSAIVASVLHFFQGGGMQGGVIRP